MKYESEYKLTDPVVHSVDRLFGATDLGVVGMESVLANHNCNSVCQQLGLQNPLKNVNIPGRPDYQDSIKLSEKSVWMKRTEFCLSGRLPLSLVAVENSNNQLVLNHSV